jgi:porin
LSYLQRRPRGAMGRCPWRAPILASALPATLFATLLMASTATAQEAEPSPATPAIDLAVTYSADLWANTSGGLARGTRYLDKLLVSATVDGGQVMGWQGASFYASAHYLNGASLTDDLVGDFQVVSNIDAGVRMVRLYEVWVEAPIGGDAASLRVGLYDVNAEYDVTDSGGLFLNSSHGIGPDISQTGRNGPSIFPVTSLAARLQLNLAESWSLKLAVLDGVPGDPDRPKQFVTIKLGGDDGALLLGELAYEPEGLKLAVGHWRYIAQFQNQLASATAEAPELQRGNAGVYALAEKKLSGAAALGDTGLAAWLRVGITDQRFNPARLFLGGGLALTAPFAARPDDRAGIAVAWVEFGDNYRRAQALAGTPADKREVKIEATYQAPITPWLTLQPDLQYIMNPGGNPELGNALVLGLRTEIAF